MLGLPPIEEKLDMMIFAFVVLVAIVLLVIWALVQLALWPKRAAVERQHPYADAINVLSWGGILLTAGLAWLGALVWAYAVPRPADDAGAEPSASLTERIRKLEARIDALKA